MVTFDLHGVHKKPNAKAIYAEIRRRLEELDLQKSVYSSDRDADIDLPRNTFVGEFSVGTRFPSARVLRKYISGKTRDVLKQVYPSATQFVLVGRGWSWGKRNVGKKKKSAL